MYLHDNCILKPFKPQHQLASSPHCSSHIPYGNAGENLFEHHNSSSLVIISLILMTEMFEQEMLLLGEIGRWSLFLGFKG